jgi:hypothetical protein
MAIKKLEHLLAPKTVKNFKPCRLKTIKKKKKVGMKLLKLLGQLIVPVKVNPKR